MAEIKQKCNLRISDLSLISNYDRVRFGSFPKYLEYLKSMNVTPCSGRCEIKDESEIYKVIDLFTLTEINDVIVYFIEIDKGRRYYNLEPEFSSMLIKKYYQKLTESTIDSFTANSSHYSTDVNDCIFARTLELSK